ncbi:hypothetical protein ACIP2Y_11575 [Streptomyces sviceus]|uniref:hypothetical protein n=1 Tax=Streptomyces sviceus TaxID=285530 RepID=UPI00381F8FA9
MTGRPAEGFAYRPRHGRTAFPAPRGGRFALSGARSCHGLSARSSTAGHRSPVPPHRHDDHRRDEERRSPALPCGAPP